jgi:hypothetical protein
MTLHAFLFAFLAAVHPQAPSMHDAPVIVAAVETVVQEEREPVFGSRQADATILVATAWFESNMHLHAVGDHGLARGAYQLHMRDGNGDALTQTRAALRLLRWNKSVCRDMPVAAYVSGRCTRGRRLARYRMHEIMKAIKRMGL